MRKILRIIVTRPGSGNDVGRDTLAAPAAQGALRRAGLTSEMSTKRSSYHHGNLREALIGATAALIAESGPHAFTLAEAARRAGIRHLVYHSVLHPQVEAMPHHWQKMRVEEQLFAAGLPYTILQPAAYMQNVLAHRVQERVRLCHGDLFGAFSTPRRFDLILANPPYIVTEAIGRLMPEVAVHEPVEALDGGADGLAFYRRLAGEGKQHLAPGGLLMLEVGAGQADPVTAIFRTCGWLPRGRDKDLLGHVRVLLFSARSHVI